MHCPYCAEQIEEGCQKCPRCEEPLGERSAVPPTSSPPVIPTPVSEEDPQELVELASANSKATLALVFGLLSFPGLLCCVVGLIFGGLGIFIGLSSNEVYRRYHLPSHGEANAGVILGGDARVLYYVFELFNVYF